MPLFKVVAEKCLGCSSRDGHFNPFLVRDIFSPGLPKVLYNVREWKLEAADEEDVRRLFVEAQDAEMPNVKGYTLQSIEQVETLAEGEPCEHRGCLNHVTHPCEGCGRIAGRSKKQY